MTTNYLHTPRKIPANGDMVGSPYGCERSSGVFTYGGEIMTKREREKMNREIDIQAKRMMTLPFIADIGKGKKKTRIFWHVKPTGDYFVDCEIGRNYGALALTYMKEYGDTPLLTQAVFGMKKKKNKGIEVGFLHFIASAAMASHIDPLMLAEYQKKRLDEVIKTLEP
jgi:hypothetical protein